MLVNRDFRVVIEGLEGVMLDDVQFAVGGNAHERFESRDHVCTAFDALGLAVDDPRCQIDSPAPDGAGIRREDNPVGLTP